MKYRFAFLLILTFMIAGFGKSAANPEPDVTPPKFEHRSVWLTTAHSLDFPKLAAEKHGLQHTEPEAGQVQDWPSEDAETASEQKEDLIEIIQTSYEEGLNAIMFQVVPRGDALYESERLPWSDVLTGTAGEDPGWDPLEVAIEEAHKRGMELHAWYNANNVANEGQPMPDEEPLHVTQQHEDWMELKDGVYYLNPGIPDTREWMKENVLEIVENYDIDAIHFDYLRYATSGFDSDSQTMEEYNENDIEELDDWRRDNVNEFLRDAYPAIKEVKPWVKVGSSAIGNYKQGTFPWSPHWGYDHAYQESRLWLEEEVIDYLAPMIYHDIDYPTPRFEDIVHDWVDNNYGRQIFIGKGPYIDEVMDEINDQIDTTRASGADGSVYFRYDHIEPPVVGDAPLEERYDINASIIPPMEWMDTDVPEAPELSIDEPVARQNPEGTELQEDEQVVNLQWNDQDFETEEGDDLIRYAVYRYNGDAEPEKEDVQENAMSLVGITGETEYTDIAPPAAHDNFYYYVSALNRNNNESDLSNAAVTEVLVSSDDEPELASEHRLHQNYPNPFNPATEISYELVSEAEVELTVYDVTGREVVSLKEGAVQSAGTHTARFDGSQLSTGVYLYQLEVRDAATGADLHTDTRRMTLIK